MSRKQSKPSAPPPSSSATWPFVPESNGWRAGQAAVGAGEKGGEVIATLGATGNDQEAGAPDARDAARYRWLRDQKCNSFSVGRDENHACNYMTAKQWIEENSVADFANVPADELQRMKDTNTIWALQVYPHTPVGFNLWQGATLDFVIDAAMNAIKE